MSFDHASFAPPPSSVSPAKGSGLLASIKAAGRALVSPLRNVGAEKILPVMLAATALCVPRTINAQGQDIYVYNQGNLQKMQNTNPDRLEPQPEYWSVWFLDNGGKKCGAWDGKTAGQAMKNATWSRDFNISFAKFIYGGTWASNLGDCSGQNMLGPIAVYGAAASWNLPKVPEALNEAWEQIQTARELWKQGKDVLDISDPRVGPKDESPYEHVGSVLKEYSKNLQDATSLLNKLTSRVLNGATLGAMGDLVRQLNTALEDLRSAGDLAKNEMPELRFKEVPSAIADNSGQGKAGSASPISINDTWSSGFGSNASVVVQGGTVQLKLLTPRVGERMSNLSGTFPVDQMVTRDTDIGPEFLCDLRFNNCPKIGTVEFGNYLKGADVFNVYLTYLNRNRISISWGTGGYNFSRPQLK